MQQPSPAPSFHRPLQPLADAASRFALALDVWLQRHGRDRGQSGARRIALLQQRAQLDRLAAASRMQRSIGFYGESQCGKSNLVSRIGRDLGARATPGGSLLVRDPSADPAGAPWAADGHPGAIEFARWLNPVNNKEATGLICRFTARGPEPVQPGCFVARLMSHSDLLISLALGHVDEIVHRAGEPDVRATLESLRGAELEDDREGFMGALLGAWRFLRERRLESSARVRELDEADWEGFVRGMFFEGKRPAWRPKDLRGSPYLRLAGMLWGCQPELDEVYKRLLDVILKLDGVDEVSIAAADVCRSPAGGGVARPSLLDVGYIDNLFAELASAGGVQVHYRSRFGDASTLGLSRAVLAAIIRELVLPVGDGEGAADSIDVLDYPGARKSTPAQDFSRHAEPAKLALQVFRRGKLNRLFLAGVDFQDCSALCLVVSGNGNLEAGPVVRQSLRAWLDREGWEPAGSRLEPARMPHEGPPKFVDPPLVVAVTKADTLLNEHGKKLFGGRLAEVDTEYCGSIPWMTQWSSGGAFRRVHWVHNPDADGARPLSSIGADVQSRIRAAYEQDELVNLHVDRAPARFSALFQRPPQDVSDLFHVLRDVTSRVRREERVLAAILDVVELLVADLRRDYLGEDVGERVRAERADAAADVAFLSRALERGRNPVSHLLRAMQVTPLDVQRACRAAAAETASVDPGEVGILRFNDFYRALWVGFSVRVEERLGRSDVHAYFLREDRDAAPARLASIREHFCQVPGAPWFRGRIEREVSAMFLVQNPAALANSSVLASVASSVWNRSIVWLDREPVDRPMPTLPPGRRPIHASSAKILAHWAERLPDVYAALVDPRDAARPDNAELGTIRRLLRDALAAFRADAGEALGAGGAKAVVARLERLEAELGPGRVS